MIKRIFLNLFATILLTVVGVWASFVLPEILLNPLSKDPEVWGLYIFVTIFVIFFTWLLFDKEQETIRAQSELIEKSDELKNIVRTLPPEKFLNLFSERYLEVHEVYKEIFLSPGSYTNEELEYAIRGLLSAITDLTKFFDRGSKDDLYSGNIMIFVDNLSKNQKFTDELMKILQFSNDDLDPKKLRGILYLDHLLSTNSDSIEADVDPKMGTIKLALPVPVDTTSATTSKFKTLPGAPLAISMKTPNIYYNTDHIGEWMKKQGDFSETIEKQVEDFFVSGPGREIKSFFSIPLSCSGSEPMAVLNVHKNKSGLLSRNDQFALYSEIMLPFFSMLAELIKKLVELRG